MELIDVRCVMVPHRALHVEGDGTCFFYSLSYHMYSTVTHAHNLRSSVVQYVCNNWQRFELYSMMPCGNIYRNINEYHAHMSLPTTYATPCEIHAASEIYPYHLVIYRDGDVILQPNEYVEEKLIFRFKCTGPMMNAHFEPLIPLYAPTPPSNVLTVCTSFVSGSTAKPHAKSECQQFSSDNSSIVINEKSRKRKLPPKGK